MANIATITNNIISALSGTTSQVLLGDATLTDFKLDSLTDVSVPTPGDGDVLRWNATLSLWEASDSAGITGSGSAGQVAYFTGATTQTGNNNLFWDSANNRLGINTNTPASALQVVGTVNATNVQTSLVFSSGADLTLATQGGTSAMTIFSTTRNVLIQNAGSISDSGQRLQVIGDAYIKGSGATNATIGLTVQDSASTNLLRLRNDGSAILRNGLFFGTSTNNYIVSSNAGNTVDVAGLNLNILFGSFDTAGYGVQIGGYNASTRTVTSGASGTLNLAHGYAPTSGTGTYTMLQVLGTINQTGGANGITRGLYVNPTLTAAADWRSIEWSNNSGWGLYGQGTANNYLAGGTGIGTTTIIAIAGYTTLAVGNATNGGNIDLMTGSTRHSSWNNTATETYFGTRSNTPLIITTNATEVAKFFANGNFRVGAAAADSGEKLQVTGTMKVTGASTFARITAVTSSITLDYNSGILYHAGGSGSYYQFISGANYSLYSRTATGALIFGTNELERMRLDASGNLGLGVTPSAWSGVRALQVGAAASLAGFTPTGEGMYLSSNAFFNGSSWIYQTSAFASQYVQLSSIHRWYTAPSGTAGNAITFTQAMTLDASGNLGIGTTTPSQKLTVYGGSSLGQVRVGFADNANWEFGRDNSSTGDFILTNNIGGTAVEGLRLKQNTARVLIGSSTDSGERLQVTGTAKITGATAINAALTITNATLPSFKVNHTAAGHASGWFDTNEYGVLISSASTSASHYLTNMTSGGTSRFYVRADGNVGIGTSSPSAQLTLNNSTEARFRMNVNGVNQIIFNHDGSTGVIRTESNTPLILGSFGSERMRIDTAGNVGIGTTSPAYKLDVVGSARVDGTHRIINAGSLRLTRYSIDSTAFGDIAFVTDSLLVSSITGSIKFGIGIPTSFTEYLGIANGGAATFVSTVTATSFNGLVLGRGNGNIASNIALGTSALNGITTGTNNVAIGPNALDGTTTGSYNIAIGFLAGGIGAAENSTGSGNIFIGTEVQGLSATESNRTWIGSNTTTATWLGGNLLLGSLSNSGEKLQVTGTAKITGASSFGSSIIASGLISSATEYRLNNNTFTRVAKIDAQGGFAGGYNLDIVSGPTVTHAETGAISGIRYAGSGNLFFFTNTSQAAGTTATTRMTLDTSGNLGLGVTPSAWSSVVPAFQIGSGGSFLAARSANPEIYLGTNARFNGTNWLYQTTNVATYYTQDTGRHIWYNAPSGTAGNAITFTQAMTLDASGNLGVGTASPSRRLSVVGTTDIISYSNGTTTGYLYSDNNGVGLFNGATATGTGIYARTSNILDLYYNGSIGLRLNNLGRILIGSTTDYGEQLQVTGTGRVGNTTGGDFRITTNQANGTIATPLNMDLSFLGYADGVRARIRAVDQSGNTNASYLSFFVNTNAGSLNENMRITSTSNLLIGSTTDSGERLQVTGTAKITGASTLSGGVTLGHTGGVAITYPSGQAIRSVGGIFVDYGNGGTGDLVFRRGSGVLNTLILAVSDGAATFSSSVTAASGIITGNLTVDTNTLFVDATNNRVGVGTASPTVPLDIVGAALFSSSVTANSFVKSGGTSTQYLMADGSVSTLSNAVTGTGTSGYLPKFTAVSTIGNSVISTATYVGGNEEVTINSTNSSSLLFYNGSSTLTIQNYGGNANLLYQRTGVSSDLLIYNGSDSSNRHISFATEGAIRFNIKQYGQVRLVPLASAPTSGVQSGDIYYDSTLNVPRYNNGTTWNDMAPSSSTYTPTLTAVTNVSSSTASVLNYFKNGSMVHIIGKVTITATAAGTTRLGVSLPVASNFTTNADAIGFADFSGSIISDVTNDRLELEFTAIDTISTEYGFMVTYVIK